MSENHNLCLHVWNSQIFPFESQLSPKSTRLLTDTHRSTLRSLGSCLTFDTQVTDRTGLSSGSWESGWSHRAGDAVTTDGAFGSTLRDGGKDGERKMKV